MDRAIKFRFWRDNEMQMAHRLNAYDNNNFAGDGEILMQFTGLYDCEGKEIYEGDIVNAYDNNCLDNIGVIEYYQNSFNLVCQDIHLSQWSNAENIYVLGNIYEHPELLNK